MNPLTDLAGGGVAAVINAVGQAADGLFTSDEERMEAALKGRELDLKEAQVDAELLKGQQEINKVEAASASLFVAGARPALLWVCVLGFGYQFLIYPFLTWGWALLQAKGYIPTALPPPPLLDTSALMVLATGMLGLSGFRTYEKVRDVDTKKVGKQKPAEKVARSGEEEAP